jgi:predicted DNA-binding protein (MmcQ/YjbR family)
LRCHDSTVCLAPLSARITGPWRRGRGPSALPPVAGGPRARRRRAICLALPETTEKVAWGEPTWRVGGKLFAQLDNHHHGADHLAVWLPPPLGEQESLIFLDPDRFFRPPYVGQRGWVGARIDRRPDWTLVTVLVKHAYREVAPPRLGASVAPATPRVLKRRST